jgi:hypothetical protein
MGLQGAGHAPVSTPIMPLADRGAYGGSWELGPFMTMPDRDRQAVCYAARRPGPAGGDSWEAPGRYGCGRSQPRW